MRRAVFLLACGLALLGTRPGQSRQASIEGTVTNAEGPAAFAQVMLMGESRGASTSMAGAFRIEDVPPGRYVLRVSQIGYEALTDSFSLEPGEVRHVSYYLRGPADRLAEARDRLVPLGLWPPRLSPPLRRLIRNASTANVFRLGPVRPAAEAPSDSLGHVGIWPIVSRAPAPGHGWRARLLRLLDRPELYLADLAGAKKLCEGCDPEVAARFWAGEDVVELRLCFRCGEFVISGSDGSRQAGDFEGRGREFIWLARRAFPKDPWIRSLSAEAYVRETHLPEERPRPKRRRQRHS